MIWYKHSPSVSCQSKLDCRLKCVAAGGLACGFQFLPETDVELRYWLGGTRAERPEQYREADPLFHLASYPVTTPPDTSVVAIHSSGAAEEVTSSNTDTGMGNGSDVTADSSIGASSVAKDIDFACVKHSPASLSLSPHSHAPSPASSPAPSLVSCPAPSPLCAYFVYHGTRDSVCPIDCARLLVQRLRQLRVHVRTQWLEGADHMQPLLSTATVEQAATFFLQVLADGTGCVHGGMTTASASLSSEVVSSAASVLKFNV